jgi:NTE family protein
MPNEFDGELTQGLIPVVDADQSQLGEGVALCLSGGGYRAMLFHLGGIIRLNEMGHLKTIARVSSVSGGSITAGVLGQAWRHLDFSAHHVARNLDELVVAPVRKLAGRTIDNPAIIWGLLRPDRTVAQMLASYYDEYLFRGQTLQDLPDDSKGEGPRFVINATNVQTGKLFRFSQPYEGDYSVGLWRNPSTRLADAVAASSAYPPTLSPYTSAPSGTFDDSTAGPNKGDVFRRELWLTDGGVYDNLGLETAWKRYRTIFVSDAGAPLGVDLEPHRNWIQHAIWVSDIVDDQVRELRKRQLIDGFERKARRGSYWGIRSDVANYGLGNPFPIAPSSVQRARGVPTRLAELDDSTQCDLINWGYVIADTALRKWVYPDAPPPTQLPAT